MNKIITCILLIFTLFAFSTKTSFADSVEAGASAMPKFKVTNEAKFDYREYTLRKFLSKFNSPLSPYSSDFIKQADFYEIDYRMVPAITGVESTFGKHIPHNSYNAYGWANGEYRFASWEDSIEHVSMTLRTKYVDHGAVSISKIAKRYAPPSTTWGTKVKYFVGKIDALPLSFDI